MTAGARRMVYVATDTLDAAMSDTKWTLAFHGIGFATFQICSGTAGCPTQDMKMAGWQ